MYRLTRWVLYELKRKVSSGASCSNRDAEVGRIDCSHHYFHHRHRRCRRAYFDDEASAALNLMKNFAVRSSKIARYIMWSAKTWFGNASSSTDYRVQWTFFFFFSFPSLFFFVRFYYFLKLLGSSRNDRFSGRMLWDIFDIYLAASRARMRGNSSTNKFRENRHELISTLQIRAYNLRRKGSTRENARRTEKERETEEERKKERENGRR